MGAQLRLFHPTKYERQPPPDDIFQEVREVGSFGLKLHNWRCGRCGQRGMSLSWPRPDLLEWARDNHQCRKTALDNGDSTR